MNFRSGPFVCLQARGVILVCDVRVPSVERFDVLNQHGSGDHPDFGRTAAIDFQFQKRDDVDVAAVAEPRADVRGSARSIIAREQTGPPVT